MAPTKFINFLAVVSFAVFYISLTPTTNALAVERAHVARNLNYAHAGIAKKKRGESTKRCRPRPSTSTSSHSSNPPAYTPPSSHHHSSSSSTTTKPNPPPTTSSSSTSHTPAATPHVSSGRGQAGLAWSNNEQPKICNFKSEHTGLVYNWKLEKYPDVDVTKCGFEYVAMIWGEKDAYRAPDILKAGYANYVLCFNEPEQIGQSNLGVDHAVQLFMDYINPLQYQGYKIISPAPTNAPVGLAWIQSFVKKVEQQGGKLHGVATHFYGVVAQDFINFMEHFIECFPNYPIWVTEWAAQDYSGKGQQLDYDGVKAFLVQTTNYMKSKPQIKTYFYFGAMTAAELVQNHVNPLNTLMHDNGTPNELGYIYID